MKVVAESIETLKLPLTAKQGAVFIDPSNAGARVITVALKPQGLVPASGDFSISGQWEPDSTVTPTIYWIAFLTPGNLVRGETYVAYVKLAAQAGESPIFENPELIRAI